MNNSTNKCLFVTKWIDENLLTFKRMYPQIPERDLVKFLQDTVNNNIKDHDARLHNDYQDDMNVKTSLLKLYDWYHTSKHRPIAGGNGVFFYNQDTIDSPIRELIDGRISDRKKFQKIRDEWKDKLGADSYEYQHFDMQQSEAKIKINSIYGAFGTPSFQLYNLYTASSTTGKAQSLISTTAVAFEAFLSNNAKFKSIGEFVRFINIVSQEEIDLPTDGITIIRDKEVVFRKIVDSFFYKRIINKSDENIIRRNLAGLNEEQLTLVYYKNNLYKFCTQPLIQQILTRIYNKTESFRNPNEVPDVILDDLNTLWAYINKFVFFTDFYIEQINRVKNDKRKSVILIDTDSNMININPWVVFNQDTIWKNSNSVMDDMDMRYCSVNILAFIMTNMIKGILKKYCSDCHVLDRFTPRINMKNEFYFSKMLLAEVKKRYVASIRLKEGKPMNDKAEIKGHDFKKAIVNSYIKSQLENLIDLYILKHPSADVPNILSGLEKIENGIKDSIRNGEIKFLTRINAKVPQAYAEDRRYSQKQVLSVLVWNIIYPEQEIELPSKLNCINVDINHRNIEKIKFSHPTEYEKITKLIFDGPIPKLQKNIPYIALPNNITQIPEWIREFVCVDMIITKNLNTFKPVLAGLGLPNVSGSSTSKLEYFSNMIDI